MNENKSVHVIIQFLWKLNLRREKATFNWETKDFVSRMKYNEFVDRQRVG